MSDTRVPSMQVHITREIINKSEPENSGRCMIAQALRIQYNASSIQVYMNIARFNVADIRYEYMVPDDAQTKVREYDEKGRGAVEPFSFVFDGNSGTAHAVVRRGPAAASYTADQHIESKGKKTPRGSRDSKTCIRRYHGVQVKATRRQDANK